MKHSLCSISVYPPSIHWGKQMQMSIWGKTWQGLVCNQETSIRAEPQCGEDSRSVFHPSTYPPNRSPRDCLLRTKHYSGPSKYSYEQIGQNSLPHWSSHNQNNGEGREDCFGENVMILFLDLLAPRYNFQMKTPNGLQALWTVTPEKVLSWRYAWKLLTKSNF